MGCLPNGFRRLATLRVAGTLTAGFFLFYLIALPPHLVHHLFDEDQARPTCPHLAQSQQTPELQPDPPALTPPLPTEIPLAFGPAPTLPSPEPTAHHPRAPPASTPSV